MAAPRRYINIELLLGISATFLSLAALIVSIFQTKIAREQQQASVWPYLQISHDHLENEFSLDLTNSGVGPAILRQIEVRYNNKSFPTHNILFRQQLNERLLDPLGDSLKSVKYGYFYQDIAVGNVLKSGDKLNLLSTIRNDQIANLMESIIKDSSFHLIIRYADIYGNCWQVNQNKVVELRKCSEH